MDYKVSRGEIDHLSLDDMSDLIACMMTLKVHDPSSGDEIVFILETCLDALRPHCPAGSVKTPWHVIHDEDLITLHRADDDKPVLLFTKRIKS